MTLRRAERPPSSALALLRENVLPQVPPPPGPEALSPIIREPPPQAVPEGEIVHIAAATAPLQDDKSPVLPAGLSAAQPQPIYTSTIGALLEKKLLSGASLSGWQYVLILNGEADGVAEIAASKCGPPEQLSFAAKYPRAYAEAISNALADAETIPGEYDLRMLRVPSLYLLAVWLHSDTGDLLLPVHPAPHKLKGRFLFTESAISAALEKLALQRRDTSDEEVVAGYE